MFLLAHGRTRLAGGRYEGVVFALFCLGLLPYMFFQLQLRVFYALHDSRTPALIGVATMITNIAVNYLALALLPARDVVAGLGLGFGLANLVGAIVAGRILSRRLGGLDGGAVTQTLVRMHVATIPAAIFALAVSVMVGAVFGIRPPRRLRHPAGGRRRRGAAVHAVRQGLPRPRAGGPDPVGEPSFPPVSRRAAGTSARVRTSPSGNGLRSCGAQTCQRRSGRLACCAASLSYLVLLITYGPGGSRGSGPWTAYEHVHF